MSGSLSNKLQYYLFKEASIFLLLTDKSGLVLECNDYTRRLLGIEPVGKKITEIFVNFDPEANLLVLFDETSQEKLLNVNTFTGLPQSLYFRFYNLPHQHLILGRRDAEEQEFMRKEIIELNNELGGLMRQLHKQKSELEKLNKLKDQFLGMAAHDLRKPVGLILNYADFVVEDLAGNVPEEDKGFLQRIRSNALFMRQIIDDFLDVALIEAGQLKLNIAKTNLSNLLEEIVSQQEILARKNEQVVELYLPGTEIWYDCDAAKLEQVMNNLIGNAIEHS